MRKKILISLVLLAVFASLGVLAVRKRIAAKTIKTNNIYANFLLEVYDKVKENYWEKITDEQLVNLYALGTQKITGKIPELKTKDKAGLAKMLIQVLKQIREQEKGLPADWREKEFAAGLADIVLANLQPFGRSRLYTRKEEKALSDNVKNINPQINQYDVLQLPKEASSSAIQKAYAEKVAELKPQATKSPEAAQKLALVEKAYQALGDEDSRKTYDLSGVEPTMEYKLIRPDIFYLHLTKFSPTTVEELQRVSEKTNDKPDVSILILDLRGNIGGAIDGLPWFLGPFIGNDQYAYQFYHQGEKTDFKTKIGWLPGLVKFKKVVILIDENSQSTAEVMASVLKKYNVGVLVGTKTKGWGTIEKVFELKTQIDPNEKYSLFLVHSLTLREDGQPIEGQGVEPFIDLKSPNWEKELYTYFHYEEIAQVIKEIM